MMSITIAKVLNDKLKSPFLCGCVDVHRLFNQLWA
jgi:hypothetical protein